MARMFTQKHYLAVADTLVAAYHSADHIGTSLRPDARGDVRYGVTFGIGKVLAQFVGTFSADSDKFDCQKFHTYIENRVPWIRSAAWQAPPACPKCGHDELDETDIRLVASVGHCGYCEFNKVTDHAPNYADDPNICKTCEDIREAKDGPQ